MNAVIETDTSSMTIEDFELLDSAENIPTALGSKISVKRSLSLDLSVGHGQKEILMPEIVKYCHLKPARCEKVVWLKDVWDSYYRVVYLAESENTVSLIDAIDYSVHTESEKIFVDKPEYTYTESIHILPSVKAIVCEPISDVKHLISILNKRNLKTREKIYSVEMKMFGLYPNMQFQFSVYCLPDQEELDNFIKNKNILYFER